MWVVRLTDKQLEVLRALLRSEEHLGPALKGSIEALDLARWDELPEAELPWERDRVSRPPPGHLRGRRHLGPERQAPRRRLSLAEFFSIRGGRDSARRGLMGP